jgi:hypothetical protein
MDPCMERGSPGRVLLHRMCPDAGILKSIPEKAGTRKGATVRNFSKILWDKDHHIAGHDC